MNYVNYFNHVLFSPETYHRRFEFDLPDAASQGKRIVLIALPFISLYRPIGSVISLGMGGGRLATHLSQALQHEEKKEWKQFGKETGQAALAATALSVTLFSCTMGLFVTTGFDCAQGAILTVESLRKREYRRAGEEALQSLANGTYLAFMATGTLELILLSTLVQAAICLYQSQEEFSAGRYLEAGAKLAFAGIRLKQANHYRQLIDQRNALFAMQKYQALIERALRGRAVRHLIEHPLSDLSGEIADKRVILANQTGEYDFGSHFHGLGKGLVKGANLSFRQVIVDGQEMTEVEFKVNHAFRQQIEKAFLDLQKINQKELKTVLRLTGSHVEGIHSESVAGWEDMGLAKKITLQGLGTITLGDSPNLPSLLDKVVVRMDATKTLYDLHEMLAFADLDTAICVSTKEDIDRLKMGHLFRIFFPKEATPFERSEDFFSLSTEQLREKMIEKAPEMEKIFETYFENISGEEILPGKVRYRINGLAEEIRQLGGITLTAAVTGGYSDEMLYERIASMLSMGMLSSETRDTNGMGQFSGLGHDYWTGGADSVFTQMLTQKNIDDQMDLNAQLYWSRARFLISLDALEMGTYQYYTDSFGNRLESPSWWWGWGDYFSRPNPLEFTKELQSVDSSSWDWKYDRHEIMLKERLDPSFFTGIILDSEKTRLGLVDYLRKQEIIKKDSFGNETILNIAVDRFFRVGTQATPELLNLSQ